MPGEDWKVSREGMPAPQHAPHHSGSTRVRHWVTKQIHTRE